MRDGKQMAMDGCGRVGGIPGIGNNGIGDLGSAVAGQLVVLYMNIVHSNPGLHTSLSQVVGCTQRAMAVSPSP